MTIELLPNDFDDLVAQAVSVFWESRNSGSVAQGGSRGNVISGKNLDGFLEIAKQVAAHCGVPEDAVHTSSTTLPGFFRPTKNWDVLVIREHRLVAVLEFKSQVGSFGNNFNNRSEEVLGNATDLHEAAQKGGYHPSRHVEHTGEKVVDPRPPFLGYMMLLEDCDDSRGPVSTIAPHYKVLPEFHEASYADRYRILCEKLMEQKLYGAAALVMTSGTGHHIAESNATSVKALFSAYAAALAVAQIS